MKSTFSKKVFEEGLIEINDTFEGATQKLKQLWYSKHLNETPTIFLIWPKGRFKVVKKNITVLEDKQISANGKIVQQSGKTYLKYQIAHNKMLFLFGIISSVIIAGFSILFLFDIKAKITTADLLIAGLIFFTGLWLLFINIKTSKYTKSDIEFIKEGVYKLADIINRWDE